MNRFIAFIFLICFNASQAWSQHRDERPPMAVAESIGDKLIKETPFQYRLKIPSISNYLNDVQSVNFGRRFSNVGNAVAYAFTTLSSDSEMNFPIQMAFNNGSKIWVNGKLVYQKASDEKIKIQFDERSLSMQDSCILPLKKGINTILIKSETSGNKDWKFLLQPPSKKGAVIYGSIHYPKLGLKGYPNIDSSVYKVSNWLLIGPFANPTVNGKRTGLAAVYMPEKELVFGKMYAGKTGKITWVLPEINVTGDVINPKEWGTSYNWNYHNGGVAWAMEVLSEETGQEKYMKYATDFCNFHINGKDFVSYQVNDLLQFNSANSTFINTPLLDFTLAPSLPYMYKLVKDKSDFYNRTKFKVFADSMIQYALYKQLRMPGLNIYTRSTPVKYTTWVDDMFMGIPFLVQAAQYTSDTILKRKLLDDAAKQIIGFNHELFDSRVCLYSHAYTSGSNKRLPYWSRANGWGIWATTEVLLNLPTNNELYPKILNYYKQHASALSALQDTSGLWFNVLDYKDSPLEVSGTAIFTMALARGIRMGWLDKATYIPIIDRAWDGLKKHIDTDGTVHDICMGTMCSEDVKYYKQRPFYDNDTHGLFAVLFACLEIEKLHKSLLSK